MLVPGCALNKHTSNLPFCLNFNFKYSVHLYLLGKCKSRFADPQNSVIVCLVSWCTDAASNPVGSRQMCNKDWKPPSHPPFQYRCTLYGEQVDVGTWKNEDLPKKKLALTFHLLEWDDNVLVCRLYCAPKICQRKSWSFKAVSYQDYVSNPTPSSIEGLQKEVLTKGYLCLSSNNRSYYFIMWTQKQPIICYKCNTKGYLGATSVLKSM